MLYGFTHYKYSMYLSKYCCSLHPREENTRVQKISSRVKSVQAPCLGRCFFALCTSL